MGIPQRGAWGWCAKGRECCVGAFSGAGTVDEEVEGGLDALVKGVELEVEVEVQKRAVARIVRLWCRGGGWLRGLGGFGWGGTANRRAG